MQFAPKWNDKLQEIYSSKTMQDLKEFLKREDSLALGHLARLINFYYQSIKSQLNGLKMTKDEFYLELLIKTIY